MGFVPGRQYEGVRGVLGSEGLRLTLDSTLEDTWFFERLWFENVPQVRVQSHEEDDGCDVIVAPECFRLSGPPRETIFENLVVQITAQGLLMIAVVQNRQTAARLRRIAGQHHDGRHHAMISFG